MTTEERSDRPEQQTIGLARSNRVVPCSILGTGTIVVVVVFLVGTSDEGGALIPSAVLWTGANYLLGIALAMAFPLMGFVGASLMQLLVRTVHRSYVDWSRLSNPIVTLVVVGILVVMLIVFNASYQSQSFRFLEVYRAFAVTVMALAIRSIVALNRRRKPNQPIRQTFRDIRRMLAISWNSAARVAWLVWIGIPLVGNIFLAYWTLVDIFVKEDTWVPGGPLPTLLIGLSLQAMVFFDFAQLPDILLLGPSVEIEVELQERLNLGVIGTLRIASLLRPDVASQLSAWNLERFNYLRTRNVSSWQSVVAQLMDASSLVIVDVRVCTPHVLHEVDRALTHQRAYKTLFIVGVDGERPALDALSGTADMPASDAAQIGIDGLDEFMGHLVDAEWEVLAPNHSLGDIAEQATDRFATAARVEL